MTKKRIATFCFLVLVVSGCKTTTFKKPLTLGMTAEQIKTASVAELCSDQKNYDIPEVENAIKTRKINCSKFWAEFRRLYFRKLSNADLCVYWYGSDDPDDREAAQKEVNRRKTDCGAILSVKAQQDAVAAQEAANIQNYWQNQQVINSMNRPRQTYCNGFSCTTY